MADLDTFKAPWRDAPRWVDARRRATREIMKKVLTIYDDILRRKDGDRHLVSVEQLDQLMSYAKTIDLSLR